MVVRPEASAHRQQQTATTLVMLVQEGSHNNHWPGGGHAALHCLEEEDGGSSCGGHQSQEGASPTRCKAAYACDMHCIASHASTCGTAWQDAFANAACGTTIQSFAQKFPSSYAAL